jgi:hypothetical protein
MYYPSDPQTGFDPSSNSWIAAIAPTATCRNSHLIPHKANTEPGFSGLPLFNQTGAVVAIHALGAGALSAPVAYRQDFNFAIRLRVINMFNRHFEKPETTTSEEEEWDFVTEREFEDDDDFAFDAYVTYGDEEYDSGYRSNKKKDADSYDSSTDDGDDDTASSGRWIVSKGPKMRTRYEPYPEGKSWADEAYGDDDPWRESGVNTLPMWEGKVPGGSLMAPPLPRVSAVPTSLVPSTSSLAKKKDSKPEVLASSESDGLPSVLPSPRPKEVLPSKALKLSVVGALSSSELKATPTGVGLKKVTKPSLRLSDTKSADITLQIGKLIESLSTKEGQEWFLSLDPVPRSGFKSSLDSVWSKLTNSASGSTKQLTKKPQKGLTAPKISSGKPPSSSVPFTGKGKGRKVLKQTGLLIERVSAKA